MGRSADGTSRTVGVEGSAIPGAFHLEVSDRSDVRQLPDVPQRLQKGLTFDPFGKLMAGKVHVGQASLLQGTSPTLGQMKCPRAITA